MARYNGPPRTRAEELMRARVIAQAEIATRMSVGTSYISHLIAGKRQLSAAIRRSFARIFECSEADLLQPIGTPIPDRQPVPIQGVDVSMSARRRIKAVLVALGIDELEHLLLFLFSGDYTRLPPLVARRFRDILEKLDQEDGNGEDEIGRGDGPH